MNEADKQTARLNLFRRDMTMLAARDDTPNADTELFRELMINMIGRALIEAELDEDECEKADSSQRQ